MQALVQSRPSGCVGSAKASLESESRSQRQVSLKATRSQGAVRKASCSGLTHNALASKVPSFRKGSSSRGVVTMKNSAADGYAAALVELGKANGSLDAIHSDMEALGNLMNNLELKDYITNPIVEDAQKKSILKTLAQDGGFSTHTVSFLNLLVDKRRINIIQEIAIKFEELYCEVSDTQVAVVTSAVKLENSQQALIAKKLQTMTGAKNIKLKNIVDPALIAGFVVKYGKDGSREIDMSVKGQLDRLAAQFDYAEKAVGNV